MLIKYHGLKNKEVAEILGISVKTVDNHLAAAICDVLEALQKQYLDSGSRMRLMSWFFSFPYKIAEMNLRSIYFLSI